MAVRRRMVLLGAGASAPDEEGAIGVPPAREMTREMLRLIKDEPPDISHAIRLAVSALVFGLGLRGEDPDLGVNIEEVFNLLDTLEKRNTLEAAPLIGSWNPVVENLDRITAKPRVRDLRSFPSLRPFSSGFDSSIREVVDAFEKMSKGLRGTRDVEKALRHFAEKIRDQDRSSSYARPPEVAVTRDIPGQGAIFRKARECLIRKLNDLAWITEEGFVGRFDPLVKAAQKEGFTIATLNYDNAIELAARGQGVCVDFGIDQWFQAPPEASKRRRRVQLLKLHGSIDWLLEENQEASAREFRKQRMRRMSREEMEHGFYDPALIFGGKNKLTARGPFLDLLMRFRDGLFKSEELVVIGYSFGDDHVNALIEEWVASGPESKVTLVCSEYFDPPEGSLGKRLLDLGKDRVANTGRRAKEGIADLFADTK